MTAGASRSPLARCSRAISSRWCCRWRWPREDRGGASLRRPRSEVAEQRDRGCDHLILLRLAADRRGRIVRLAGVPAHLLVVAAVDHVYGHIGPELALEVRRVGIRRGTGIKGPVCEERTQSLRREVDRRI